MRPSDYRTLAVRTCEALGLNPGDVSSLQLHPDHAVAHILCRDENGRIVPNGSWTAARRTLRVIKPVDSDDCPFPRIRLWGRR